MFGKLLAFKLHSLKGITFWNKYSISDTFWSSCHILMHNRDPTELLNEYVAGITFFSISHRVQQKPLYILNQHSETLDTFLPLTMPLF